MVNLTDTKIANLGAGFTIGFGIWTVWTATKQTMAHRRPSRSVYIWMVWGEILSNYLIAIVAWLYLDGVFKPGVPIYFFITFLWVFEIQLLMQIIINRVAVVVTDHCVIWKIKWGTAVVLTLINISVFIVWIPAQLEPPPIPVMVDINKYFDRITKGLILIIDASLNLYFLSSVRKHLVKEHGLVRYKPLVRFNARLMAVSVSMDLMLIILESLPGHGIIWEQFHPVAYMVKLNIEMTMAALIAKIASGSINNLNEIWYQADGHPPEYNYENAPNVRRGSTGSGQDLTAMDLSEWPTVLNGTTSNCASGTVRQLGDTSPIKSPTKSNLHAIEAPHLVRNIAHINNTTHDREISNATEERVGRGRPSVTEIREPDRPRFGLGVLGRTMRFGQHPNSSDGKLGGSDPGNVSPESRARNDEDDDRETVRTKEVEVKHDEAGDIRKKKRKSKLSRIDDRGDYIGRPRSN